MSKLDILYQSSNVYAPITGISILSLLMNNLDIDKITIHLINDEISADNVSKIIKTVEKFDRDIVVYDSDDLKSVIRELSIVPFDNRLTTYLKLFLFDNLDFDKVLTMDSDTIIVGSLKELWHLKMNGKVIAATYDCAHIKYKEIIGLSDESHLFNGGVMLVDLEQWKKKKCLSSIINHISMFGQNYQTADQDLVNIVLQDEIMYMNLKYNFNCGFNIYGISNSFKIYGLDEGNFRPISEIQYASDNVVVYHCMGLLTGRPWEANNKHPQRKVFDKYRDLSLWKETPNIKIKQGIMNRIQKILYYNFPIEVYIIIHSKFLHVFQKCKHKKLNK